MTVEALSERDWRLAVDIIYQLNAVNNLKDFRKQLLKLTFSAISSDQIMFNLVERSDDGIAYTSMDYIGEEPRYYDVFQKNIYNDENTLLGISTCKKTTAFRDTDMLPVDSLLSSKLYKEILLPHGFRYVMRSFFIQDGEMLGALAFFASQQRGDFSDRDIRFLKVLAPHIAQRLSSLLKNDSAQALGNSIRTLQHAFKQFNLTPREVEVIELIQSNLSDDEIAEKLFMSPFTVKKHVSNIYRKLGVKNRMQLHSTINTFFA